jgi:hypothetical protein
MNMGIDKTLYSIHIVFNIKVHIGVNILVYLCIHAQRKYIYEVVMTLCGVCQLCGYILFHMFLIIK